LARNARLAAWNLQPPGGEVEELGKSDNEFDFEEIALAPLLQRVVRGETAAMLELFDATSRMLYGLTVKILPDRNLAEEVLLDSYSQIWRTAGSYSPGDGSVSSWMVAIVRARAIERLRMGKFAPPRLDASEPGAGKMEVAAEGSPSPVSPEWRNLISTSLESLSPEQRQVIELAYYSGLCHGEIAARIGQPLGAVRIRIRLGMLKLSDLLRPVLQGFH
jgi:RNA polymerase sigma-70 factor, ECF subfamily